ncbi:MAG: prephenate dehydrogenase/arogenate dehydrogenase family protein [Candidatus Gastranaerophilales bacterium]|nr:prephenate dehydrogenase/arogenate dehydrogenase family protein [Candidatus Gastranaerophilales bacterium]
MQITAKKIAVIGLGLIGGSLLRVLCAKGFDVVGISKSEQTLEYARNLNIAKKISDDINDAKDADIIFICTPMNKICSILDQLQHIVSKNCIVTDAGSLKNFILDYVHSLEKPMKFIGGHPMAGTEFKGIDHSFEALFEDAKWVLVPSKYACDDDLNTLKSIIELIGAKTVLTDAKNHDKAVAMISHAPMILSQALYASVLNCKDSEVKDLALNLASSGFRDMTRLAMSNLEMANDMILNNNQNISDTLNEISNNMLNLVKNYDMKKSEEIFDSRKQLYSENGKNVYLKNN